MFLTLISQICIFLLSYIIFVLFDFNDIIYCRLFCKENMLNKNNILYKVFPYKNSLFRPRIKQLLYPVIITFIFLVTTLVTYIFYLINKSEFIFIILSSKYIAIIIIVEFVFLGLFKSYISFVNNLARKKESSMSDIDIEKLCKYLNDSYPDFGA